MESTVYTLSQRLRAWSVHLLTAVSGILGLFALKAIHLHEYVMSFWLMGACIAIDAVDGTLARYLRVKEVVPVIDGALLDNMMDFITYVIIPMFFVIISPLLANGVRDVVAGLVVFASAYQFTQSDAKTEDHFFKGFPCYWNFVIFYLFILHISQTTSAIVIVIFALLVFVPIKYVHPFRLNYLSRKPWKRKAMFFSTILFALAAAGSLLIYPSRSRILLGYSFLFMLFYFIVSLYRTYYPMLKKKIK